MPEGSNAVFLSYASEDAEAAQRISQALRAAGVEVWFDREELHGGDAWDQRIRKQIRDCRLFLPIVSRNTEARLEGYFRREWKLAIDRTEDMASEVAFLVPVVIDETANASAHVPEKFRQVQWTRLRGAEATPAFVGLVSKLLTTQSPAVGDSSLRTRTLTHAASPLSESAPPLRLQASWYRTVLIAGACAAALLGAGYVAFSHLHHRGVETTAMSASTTVSAAEKSIAVLPFADLSEKQDQQYFADGLAEEILDLLVKTPGLHVVGRTSSFQFRGHAEDLRKVGAALGAAYVVEGSVRRAGDLIRVTAQLISARDGMHRWSDTYSGSLHDVFQLQDSIAADLARSLELTVSTDNAPRTMSKLEAYELFLQGRQALDSASEEGTNRAITLLKEASRLDPGSSRTLSALASAYVNLGAEGWGLPNETFNMAGQMAEQALKLDPNNGQAHAALANVAAIYEWNWTKAEQEIDAALRLSGRDSETLVTGAQILSAEGKYDRAQNLANEALAKDPLYADVHITLGAWIYLRTGKYADAEREIRRGLQIRPHWGTGQLYLATALLQQGRLPEAFAEAQREAPRDGKYQGISVVLHAMHRNSESDDALKQAIAQSESDWPSSIAKVFAFRSQKDEALKWLNRAYDFRDEDLYWIKDDPLMQPLEREPRYKAFLHKLNLPD